MRSSHQPSQLEVLCPSCPESYFVPVDVIQASQRLLVEMGPCCGMASYECPAPYFASLATPEAIAELAADEVASAVRPLALARWENEGGASYNPP